MRRRAWILLLGLGLLNLPTALSAADGTISGAAPPAMTGYILLFLVAFVVFLSIVVLRTTRWTRATASRDLAGQEQHRRVAEDHMKRLESQIDRLDEKLGRLVALLEAVERQ
jgi:hypothetical protein